MIVESHHKVIKKYLMTWEWNATINHLSCLLHLIRNSSLWIVLYLQIPKSWVGSEWIIIVLIWHKAARQEKQFSQKQDCCSNVHHKHWVNISVVLLSVTSQSLKTGFEGKQTDYKANFNTTKKDFLHICQKSWVMACTIHRKHVVLYNLFLE